jgi:ribokinase
VNSSRIIVVGSANQDYLVRVPRAPGPGETTLATGMTKQPGGKGANQAVAAARLGGDVHFVGAVGRDDDGARILRALQTEGASVDDVRIIDQQPTGLALITVEEGGENSIVVVSGANATVTAERAGAAVDRLAGAGAIVVVQGELSRDVLASAVRAAARRGARSIVNLAPFAEVDDDVLAAADPLVVNESEAGELLGSPVPDAAAVTAALGRLLEHAASVVVTLGGEGAVWAVRDGASGHVPARKVDDVVDTTGAGDAFVGAMAASLATGSSLEEAVRLGARAGSFAIGGVGAQTSYARSADLGLPDTAGSAS